MCEWLEVQGFSNVFEIFLGTVYFNHSKGCQKCTVIGEYNSCISFYSCYDEKRTDFSFRNKLDPQHHKVTSVLEQLPTLLTAIH